jgi:ribosome maturation factor RimP
MAPTDVLRALAEPLLAAAGLELWDIEVSHDVVRVLVDRDGGIDLEALSDASRALSTLLDDHDDVVPAGRYQLEISSPGLERTLRTPEQYRRYLGTTVSVKTRSAVGGARRHRGILTGAGDDTCEVRPDAAPTAPLTLPYDQIERTRTVFEWGPAPKPGARPKTASRRAAGREVGAGAPNPKDHSR